jgi:nicotinamide-nucleotide amidase
MNDDLSHVPSADLNDQLAKRLLAKGWSLATAESGTGGMIAAFCTELSGSSQWFERGFVSYSNLSKQELLGVDGSLIERHGAVSEEVARAMALGALRRSRAQVALAVTGVAGPTGGSLDKPVGCVWFAWAVPGSSGPSMGAESAWIKSQRCDFPGSRSDIRKATLTHAIQTLLELI